MTWLVAVTSSSLPASGLAALAVLVWPQPASGLGRLRVPTPLTSGPPAVHRLRLPAAVRRALLRAERGPDLQQQIVTLLEAVAGALRAGLPPSRALDVVASAAPGGQDDVQRLVIRLAALSAHGAPLEPAWRRAAHELDSPAVAAVAEAWALTERHGAPVVDVLDALTGALRDQRRAAAAVDAALAAPRATASLLGVLPVGGLLLGEVVGLHPLSLLLGAPAGRIAGTAGLVCTAGGRVWMRRLVAKAQPR
jgi:tight adherence protein B